VETAVVGGLVAQQEPKLPLLAFEIQGLAAQAELLQHLGALGEPKVLCHLLDEDPFGESDGLMLGAEAG
jgi:hypothetical protein